MKNITFTKTWVWNLHNKIDRHIEYVIGCLPDGNYVSISEELYQECQESDTRDIDFKCNVHSFREEFIGGVN